MKRALTLLLVVQLAPGCAMGSGGVTIRGRQMTAVAAREARTRPIEGELLAAEPEKIWVLGKEQVFEVPLSSIEEVRVRRHDFTARKAFLWSVIGAVITGGALAAACGAAHDVNGNCGNVFAVVGGIWLAAGGLAAASMRASSTIPLPSPKAEDLRPYARFPQGIPAGFDPQSLRRSPSPSP